MDQIFGVFVVIMITLLGVSNFKKGINKIRLKNCPEVKEVEGTVVDYVEKICYRHHRQVRLYPVCECCYDGETYTHVSKRWKTGARRIGEKKTLYIDTRENKIFEKSEMVLELYYGILFGGFGLFLFVVFIMLL